MNVNLLRSVCLGFALAGLLAAAPPAVADGGYMPARAIRKIPAIPAQRAVLAWKDGVETLVISSALDSESQRLGWIIPLPAVPDAIEKESPGALKTLNFCVQPRITHDPVPGLPTVVVLTILVNLLLAVGLFKRHRFTDLLCVIGILAILSGLLLPALSGAGGSAAKRPTSLRLEKSARVGSYDISVLRSKKAEDLDVWLGENGFAVLPQAAARTIDGYIRDGWVFAAIKFVREEGGANAPHPVRVTFKAGEPVYPMKLTAMAGGTTAFEIFVIADKKVSCDALAEEFCDRFSRDGERWGDYATGEWYKAIETGTWIGHPVICKLMWDGCILTKFSGTIGSDKMTDDLHFAGVRFGVRQRHLYTREGAREVSLMFMVALFGLVVFISMVGCRNRLSDPQGKAWYFIKVILPAVVLSGICSWGIFLALPKLSAAEVSVSRRFYSHVHASRLASEVKHQFGEHPELAILTETQIAAHLMANVMQNYPTLLLPGGKAANPISGGELQVEDTPGNFTVEKGLTNIAIRIYDSMGRPMVCNFPVVKSDPEAR